MLVELHILQNFAPSNLNRDDTGAPKDCEFGGYRRARISSQCLKRAIRTSFRNDGLLEADSLAVRTRRLVEGELVPRFTGQGRDATEARQVAEAALSSVGISLKGDNTQYLLFLGQREIDAIEQVCLANWELLVAVQNEGADAKKGKKDKKKAMPKEIGDAIKRSLDGGKAADLALFGRMLADLPVRNVDAASQVAHAISTHRVDAEFDFYTAVDDLQAERSGDSEADVDAGAGMLGTIEFNSACYYRYANVDVGQLLANLQGDAELARATLSAFVRASVRAVPTGKQNSMAAHNPPSLVFATVRDTGAQNLANAFVRPVRPSRDGDLIANSVRELGSFQQKLVNMYGDDGLRGSWVASTEDGATSALGVQSGTLDALVQGVLSAVDFGAAVGQ